ncbi:hypothetical protein PIB30_082282 [Stylosanthes scabra]|uniref:Uncharacterized protein n=1 Tax=Stylosanthes scabra TaxID=79078 RepID=A0ABU6QSH4_9FABA|nr:hypothetical protein [Stylosanthes scabra]
MVSSRVVDFFPSKRDQRGLQGGHQGKRLSAARVLPHGGRQCSDLFTGKRSSSAASTRQGFKEGGLRCSELGTDGGWDLQGHSDAQASRMECTASAIVRVRESNPYFCGMRSCSYFD